LPAWRPLFLHRGDAGDVVRRLGRTPLAAEPGARVLYSDLGYLLAGVLLARAGGAPLDDLYTQHILAPCEPPAREPCFRPPPAWRSRLAPGEVGDEIHRELASCHEAAVQAWPGWRAGVHLGEVHDLNAAALGGVAGHAGLFGSAAGVAALAAEFLPGSRLFTPAERAVFRYSRTSGQEEDRAVGFRVAARTWSLVPAACSPDSFGHTGFTGTLVLIDPATAGVFVLLTNRLHPHPPAAGMAGLRRGFLARAAALLERTAGEAGKGPGDGRGGGRSALQ
ncbi:MAG: serine hydrolase, partial [Rhodospirillales bacterium]